MSAHGLAPAPVAPQSSAAINDPYIEGRAHCAPDAEGGECFLPPGVRARLVSGYQDRVNAAYASYSTALMGSSLRDMMRGEPDMPLVTTIALAAISMVAGKALDSFAKAMRASPRGFLPPEVAALSSAAEMAGKMTHADESALGMITKTAIDTAKNGTKAAVDVAARAGEQSEFDRERTASQGFFGQLMRTSAGVFQDQREIPPGIVGDAELIMLFHAWDARRGHSTDDYDAAIAKQLAAFRRSPASKIGVARRSEHEPTPLEPGERRRLDRPDRLPQVPSPMGLDGRGDRIETKLVMQVYDDAVERLAYYHRAIGPNTEWHAGEFVGADMRDAAIAQNTAQWGVPFERKQLGARPRAPHEYMQRRAVDEPPSTLTLPDDLSPAMRID